MRGKRLFLLVLSAVMVLTMLPGTTMAAAGDIKVQEGYGSIVKSTTSKSFSVEVPLIATVTSASVTGVTVVGGKYTTIENDIGTIPVSNGTGGTKVLVDCRINADVDTDSLILRFAYDGGTVDVQLTVLKTQSTPLLPDNNTNTPDKIDPQNPAILVLAATDASGNPIQAPTGNAGQTIQVRLPIFNRGKKSTETATDIRVTPVLSASLDAFPFVIDEVDYSRKVPDMKPGGTQEIVYSFKFSKDVTSGVKEIKFNVVYYNREKQVYETGSFSVFVTVVKGAKSALTGEDGKVVASTPKVIIESYTLAPSTPQDGDDGRIYAGEVFTLTTRVRNTADETVQNIQVTLSNDGSVIIPANNGSNSLYIDRIGAGDIVERTVELQSVPDAEPKTQVLSAKFSYESAQTLISYDTTESIAIPLLQRTRVRVDDPVKYGEIITIDSAVPIYLSLYNMGKSSLYNCMVDVEGEGLRMEETFFGGTVSAGGQMRADFNIIPSTAGDIEAAIVITFEDAYGAVTRVEKPLALNVQEGFGGDMWGEEGMMPDGGMPGMVDIENGSSKKMPSWLWITLIAVVLIGAVVVFVTVRRKRRKAELTEGV